MALVNRKTGIISTDEGWQLQLTRNNLRIWNSSHSATFSVDLGDSDIAIYDDPAMLCDAEDVRAAMFATIERAMFDVGLSATIIRRC